MNNNEDIDIYELVNDLSFDLDDIVEIELDEISKKRINKNVKKRIKRGFSKRNKVIASTIATASLFFHSYITFRTRSHSRNKGKIIFCSRNRSY